MSTKKTNHRCTRMNTDGLNHGCTRMHTDFNIKVDVHFKDGSAKMIRTFRGGFSVASGATLTRAAAVMVADLETQPNYPADPTRLVVSLYPKKKKTAKKHRCPSVSIGGSKGGAE